MGEVKQIVRHNWLGGWGHRLVHHMQRVKNEGKRLTPLVILLPYPNRNSEHSSISECVCVNSCCCMAPKALVLIGN